MTHEILNNEKRNLWLRISIIAATFGLCAVPLIAAATTSASNDEMTEKAMTAKVLDVDVQAGTLTVERIDTEIDEALPSEQYEAEKSGVRGTRVTLVVDRDTRITDPGGLLTTLADLKPGDRVNIRYEMLEDGRMHATGVESSPSK